MVAGLTITLLVIGLVLIVLIILQSGKVKNIGASIVGTKDIELFDQKKRGFEKWLHYFTILLVLTFVIIAFALLFISTGA